MNGDAGNPYAAPLAWQRPCRPAEPAEPSMLRAARRTAGLCLTLLVVLPVALATLGLEWIDAVSRPPGDAAATRWTLAAAAACVLPLHLAATAVGLRLVRLSRRRRAWLWTLLLATPLLGSATLAVLAWPADR